MTLKAAGTTTVTAKDAANSAITGSLSATVNPNTANLLVVNGMVTPRTAGASGSVTVAAKDSFGNVATGYSGTVVFTSTTDSQALLPAAYTFTSGDQGTHTFSGLILKTSGPQSVTATDSAHSLSSSQSGVTVNADPSSLHLVMTGLPASVVAGSSNSVSVAARDTYQNLEPTYTGTLRFTTNDPQQTLVVLPTQYTFVSGDGGVHTFAGQVKLVSAGSEWVTATDTVTTSYAVTQTSTVLADHSTFRPQITGLPASTNAGVQLTPVVTTRDVYGNQIGDYIGTIHFASTDPGAYLPSDYTFQTSDAGTHSYPLVFEFHNVGTWTATVSDVGTSANTTSGAVSVGAGETNPPQVNSLTPSNNQVLRGLRGANQLLVSTSYLDAQSGVDTNSVHVLMDGTDITSHLSVTTTLASGTANVSVPPGSHLLQLTVADRLGNVTNYGNNSAASAQFYIDTSPPSITWNLVAGAVLGSPYTVQGTWTDDLGVAGITINGQAAQVTTSAIGITAGTFALAGMIIPDGQSQVSATVTDFAGRTTSLLVDVYGFRNDINQQFSCTVP